MIELNKFFSTSSCVTGAVAVVFCCSCSACSGSQGPYNKCKTICLGWIPSEVFTQQQFCYSSMPRPHEPYSGFLGMWIYGRLWLRKLGGCKSEIGGDVCLQLNRTKLALSRPALKKQRGPRSEKGNVSNCFSHSFILVSFTWYW